MIAAIGLPELAAGAMALSLNAYVLLGGADFGGGVWDLLARGPRRDAQRALVADAIAPIWEANHVWLILVVVLCFTCFPPALPRRMSFLLLPWKSLPPVRSKRYFDAKASILSIQAASWSEW